MVGTLVRRIANPATDTAAGILETATQAEQEAATAVDKTVTPGRQHFHPSAAKAWAKFADNGALYTGGYNIASITDNGTGFWTVNIATDFSSAHYAVSVCGGYASGGGLVFNAAAGTAGSFQVFGLVGGVATDPSGVNEIYFVAYGDQ